MMSHRDTIRWVRAKGLKLELLGDGRVLAWLSWQSVDAGIWGLAIVEAFAAPARIGDVLESLGGRLELDASGQARLEETLRQLCREGVLVDASGAQAAPSWEMSFVEVGDQSAMLNDRERTEALLEAVTATVREGDVVVDIGTGNGVLALAAANAGARRVYAIEASSLAELAEQVFVANRVDDRVTLVRDWSTRVTLPEKADVVVSEIIGHDPLAENLLEVMLDAKARLLKPGARFVPQALEVWAQPLEVPESVLASLTFSSEDVVRWQSWYDLNFAPLLEIGRKPQWIFVRPYEIVGWTRMSDELLVADVELATLTSPVIETTVSGMAKRSGRVNGVLLYFRMAAGGDAFISTKPGFARSSCSWKNALWLLPEPVQVEVGQGLELRYRYGSSMGSEVSLSVSGVGSADEID
ncbi:MAG: hypothetical protein CO108_04245 [Deltaproteobacteria bacterium CG_4_9_14_3_um_filter_63_12]|nr:MAG: hypothetical protein CO108_04245 [Deltaproteobacteria bacterium CG_4_9_14_3_um_filter_63_12]